MSQNPFSGWSKEDVERHNARVASSNKVGRILSADPPINPKPSTDVKRKEHPAKRIRQSSKPLLNKLESDYFKLLSLRHPPGSILAQAIRVKLGNGIWFKPDLFKFQIETAPDGRGTLATAWELKGEHSFRGGFENLKVAAGLYPQIQFILVWRNKAGQWTEQPVLP